MRDPDTLNQQEETDLAGVLRAAGQRPRPPADVATAVRSAVLAEWRHVVAERKARTRRLRIRWSLAAAIVLGIGGIAAAILQTPGDVIANVARTEGDVSVVAGWSARGRAAFQGQALRSGQQVLTGDSGRVALELARLSVRLDHATQVALVDPTHIKVARGSVYLDSGSGSPGASLLHVETPAGEIHHVGTQYAVRVLPSGVELAVREGKVELDTPGKLPEVATAGQRLDVSAAGSVARSTLRPDDAYWSWASSTAPQFDISGRKLSEFLSWAARESGRELVYATPQSAAAPFGLPSRR